MISLYILAPLTILCLTLVPEAYSQGIDDCQWCFTTAGYCSTEGRKENGYYRCECSEEFNCTCTISCGPIVTMAGPSTIIKIIEASKISTRNTTSVIIQLEMNNDIVNNINNSLPRIDTASGSYYIANDNVLIEVIDNSNLRLHASINYLYSNIYDCSGKLLDTIVLN